MPLGFSDIHFTLFNGFHQVGWKPHSKDDTFQDSNSEIAKVADPQAQNVSLQASRTHQNRDCHLTQNPGQLDTSCLNPCCNITKFSQY